jgi:Holliday junction resolvase
MLKELTSEEIVKEHFEKNGYVVAIGDNENQSGFDLVAIKNSNYITVEVKTACKLIGKRSWRVREVLEFAKKCRHYCNGSS